MSVDLKLFRIFEEASKGAYLTQRALAEHMFTMKLDEFSYSRQGITTYSSAETIAEYVSLLVALEILNRQVEPFARVTRPDLKGFENALAGRSATYATASGFSPAKIKAACLSFLNKSPKVLPTPGRVFEHLKPSCSYTVFVRILSLQSLTRAEGVGIGSRSYVTVSGAFTDG